ncbi:LacI family transcriptional regulator [Opitutaceae bacterium TAV5]|nr:LacI family transcriptional regulator [Opitutaceae bacterium TAV5]
MKEEDVRNSPRRPSQADVGRRAGVTAATVSWALRNDPRIPAATQQRVLRAAEELGYTPDPVLAALVARRDRHRSRVTSSNLAALVDDRWQAERMRSWHRSFINGMKRACERLGYALDVLQIQADLGANRQPDRIMHGRGIRGMVLLPLQSHDVPLCLKGVKWERFSIVVVGNPPESLPFHRVGSDAFNAMHIACNRLRELGYRRIGLAHALIAEQRLRYEWLGAMSKELFAPDAVDGSRLEIVPPCLPEDFCERTFTEWVRVNRPEAVVGNDPAILEWLPANGWSIPRDIGVALLNRDSVDTPVAGISQHLDISGETAVEQLHTLLLRGETGFPEIPREVLIRPHWVDGPTLRKPRRSAAHSPGAT